jgi:type IV pilus assembly protein PilC
LDFLQNRVKFADLTSFTRQFSAMMQAKISLIHVLEIICAQSESKVLKDILGKIKNDVQSGVQLHQSMAAYPKIFSQFYINMVRVGEMTGKLDYMLNKVAVYLEKMNSLRRKLIQSLSYPLLIIGVAISSVAFLLTYVVPSFADMFRDFDAELPAITVFLMMVSDFIVQYFWIFIFLIIIIILGSRAYIKTENGRKNWSLLLLYLPIAGPILKKNYISHFSRTLSILLESGVPMLNALKVTADSIPNIIVEREINQMAYFAEKGERLTRSMQRSKVFPPMVTQMITVGEETAQLDKMLEKAAEYYEDEMEATLTNLTTVMEPVIIIVLGIVLGTILIALYMPLFDLVNILPG